MDDSAFDRLVRSWSCHTPRRLFLASAVATVVTVSAGDHASVKRKKRKCRKSQKRCGKACLPISQCCTSDDCTAGFACTNGTCACVPQCTGRVCGPNGCGGSCGTCSGAADCESVTGQCVTCTPQCAGKTCGPDGCGGTCGSCENGTCASGQCVCQFDEPCSLGQCCPNEQACQDGACAACPATPDACAVEIVCGRTTAVNPLCYCVTSVDDVTTCSSVFINPSQAANCTGDEDCVGLLGFGVEMVCVDVPCLGLGFSKVCMNQGCEDLSPGRARSTSEHDETKAQQAAWQIRPSGRSG